MRDYQKLKTLEDYSSLDAPIRMEGMLPPVPCSYDRQMVLRMLVRPKYGQFCIPEVLRWLQWTIYTAAIKDTQVTGIKDSWCYVTVRHGLIESETDDQWHFDGASFRTDIIPERNYCWVSSYPIQYKTGDLQFPSDFDPTKHDLFSFAANQLTSQPIRHVLSGTWYLINPFCLHRRNPDIPRDKVRTFIRICFTDIEGRDINNTPNPLLPTPFFGRDPVKTFRDKLKPY